MPLGFSIILIKNFSFKLQKYIIDIIVSCDYSFSNGIYKYAFKEGALCMEGYRLVY
jgi:hypothetical protein